MKILDGTFVIPIVMSEITKVIRMISLWSLEPFELSVETTTGIIKCCIQRNIGFGICIFCDFLNNKMSKESILFGASWTIY